MHDSHNDPLAPVNPGLQPHSVTKKLAAGENALDGHVWHGALPFTDLYFDVWHAMHVGGVPVYPALQMQSLRNVLLSGEYDPCGQFVHSNPFLYFPDRHPMQALDELLPNLSVELPAGQTLHVLDAFSI